ncbi:hypothetical protein [Deinococcus planocerae]|uniref:hypothetical protein n=1 Tax=Deinococcus planocerae TaxID=1737569 RepID=UPI000C7F24FE|nr:hypothetical protein [Deinococcus planocerae]
MRPAPAVVAGVLVGLLGLGGWFTVERRWQGDLYCIGRPGTLWNGLAPLPGGLAPECPTYSRSYRAEVRRGESRIEQYRLPGWQPRALLGPFRRAGYRQLTDDALPGSYSAFLNREGDLLQYHATREGNTTLIAISGQP